MTRVHIYGAGSIGNHLANACRSKGWSVAIADTDPAALRRTKEDIYPSRYGQWDDEIELTSPESLRGSPDVAIVGTPPDTHMGIAIDIMKRGAPGVLLIEKPLCVPDLRGADELLGALDRSSTVGLVGYNHTMTPVTAKVEARLRAGAIGNIEVMYVRWLEHWGGIFSAHPWLSGPSDTYLGFSDRGGGACGEHSHAINLWQHIARLGGQGRVQEVTAVMNMVEDEGASYDKVAMLNLVTEKGLVGNVIQDVVSAPAVKTLRVQGTDGCLEWFANYQSGVDAVIESTRDGQAAIDRVEKTRPDDFRPEIDHVGAILEGSQKDSPISMRNGFDTMLVVAAAYKSARMGRSVSIDYAKGYNSDAIVCD